MSDELTPVQRANKTTLKALLGGGIGFVGFTGWALYYNEYDIATSVLRGLATGTIIAGSIGLGEGLGSIIAPQMTQDPLGLYVINDVISNGISAILLTILEVQAYDKPFDAETVENVLQKGFDCILFSSGVFALSKYKNGKDLYMQ